jgi:hypothetical protein
MKRIFAIAIVLIPAVAASSAEPWTTYRADPQRSGCADGKPGPASPRVLWAMKTKEHFIASPVVYKDRLYVSGLSFLNSSVF